MSFQKCLCSTLNFLERRPYVSLRYNCSIKECPIIALCEVRRFIMDCLKTIGVPEDNAKDLCDTLIEADYRGMFSHGINRLDYYINEIQAGLCDCVAKPEILKEGPATAWVDGKNGLGAVVGKFSMGLAIQKAKQVGIGWVVARDSCHFGFAQMYTLMAVNSNLLGFCCSNTSLLMVPANGKCVALGTNPLAVGAPAGRNQTFIFDAATSAASYGIIEMHKKWNLPLRPGWALDERGRETTDAATALKTKKLVPFAHHKGYAFALMVEIFAAILSDSSYGRHSRNYGEVTKKPNNGHCFFAVDPNCFAPGFQDRLYDLMCDMRTVEPIDPQSPVVVPGDIEAKHMTKVVAEGGLRYVPEQIEICNKLAAKLKVKPLISS